MEENNISQQNHNGTTPPPLPQPATPPPFKDGEDNGGEQGKNDGKDKAENAAFEKTTNAEAAEESVVEPINNTPSDASLEEAEDGTAARIENTPGTIPSPAQMERLIEETDRELKAFDAEPLPNVGLFARAFSFKGRITRAEFLISHALIPLHFLLVSYVATIAAEIAGFTIGTEAAGSLYNRLMLFSGLFAFCWFYTAQGVKRCHDVGWNGWWFYIPFINLPLLFKKTLEEPNRYGLPATIRTSEAEHAAAAALSRKRGIWCAVSWLVCSPVYLYLTWRWKIQKPMARLIMLLVSPLIISIGYTTHVAREQIKTENTYEARAVAMLSQKNLSIALPIDEAQWRGRERLTGLYTYNVSFEKALTEKDFKRLEALSRQAGSGWAAYQDEAEAENADDYGYFMEDYGKPAASSQKAPSQCFRFSKTLKDPKDKKDYIVTLTILRHADHAKLTLQQP